MEKKNQYRLLAGFTGLLAALVILVFWNIGVGSIHLPPHRILEILFNRTGEDAVIIWSIRLPRILSALLLGGALSLSGFLLQTFFANPIAGPFILGISSGAKLVLSLTLIGFLSRGVAVGSFVLIMAAFAGAVLSMGFVLAISLRTKQMSLLIISGVMIGYICSAITDFAVTFADDANIVNLHHWSLGSFSGLSWENVGMMTAVVIPSLVFSFLLSKPISAYQLGEEYARNMGLNLRLFRILLIVLSSLLSACVTAFAGPISFVGVAVPHLIRGIFKTAKPLVMVPACFLGGAVFCLFCDLIARTIVSPAELSISSVTAVFGAPIVLFVMLRRQKDNL